MNLASNAVVPGTVLSIYVGEELEDETRRLLEDFQEVQTLEHVALNIFKLS